MMRRILAGTAAGAAGTTALNAVTYGDMAVRGRGGSAAPEEMVERLSATTGLPVPGEGGRRRDDEVRSHRISGLGPLLGLATGVGIGTLYGAARGGRWEPTVPVAALATGVAAMAGTDLPMAVLGISDPREWKPGDWLADLVPHLLYGAATAAAYELTVPRRNWRRPRR